MTESLAAAIVTLLKADAVVNDLIQQRIYPVKAPDNVPTPYVVYSEITSDTEESHDDANGLDGTQVQFACYADTSRTAILLRAAIRAALATSPSPLSGVKVTQPTSRTLPADELRLDCAILELTFMHHPTS